MTIVGGKSEPTVVVTCPDCGDKRTITVSYKRRLDKEHRPAPCEPCRRADELTPTDDDWWFWLEAHGVKRNGISPQEHVIRYGLPDELQTLVDLLRPEAL